MTKTVELIRKIALREMNAMQSASRTAGVKRITWETVQQVLSSGKYQVKDLILSTAGLKTYSVGDVVPVAWRDGRPAFILGHNWMRAKFSHSHRVTSKGIVEELIVANFDGAGNDIWYRNHAVLVKLEIPTLIENRFTISGPVKWGLDGNSFGIVGTSGYYAVVRLDRDDPNIYSEENPGTPSLYWAGKPLDLDVNITNISFTNKVTRTVREWFGILDRETYYTQGYTGGAYYWRSNTRLNKQGWDAPSSAGAQGAATVSSSKTYNLKALLANQVADWYGNKNVRITMLDWYLDNDLNLKFVYKIEWDYHYVGTSQTGVGTVTWPIGEASIAPSGEIVWGPKEEQITVGGTAVTAIGAKKNSDKLTIPETHVFVLCPQTSTVEWGTAELNPMRGQEQIGFSSRLLEHNKLLEPSYPGILPDPHFPIWDPPNPPGTPKVTDNYYTGSSVSVPGVGISKYTITEGEVGDEAFRFLSSNGTLQLFDPSKLPALQGPYSAIESSSYQKFHSMLGGWNSEYLVNFRVRTGGMQQLWHYTIENAQIFRSRNATGKDDARIFIVVHRYPYIAGTGYINDIPQIWIGVLNINGGLILTLRDWQYGLGSGTLLISGNGHRIIWKLATGWIQPTYSYRTTNLELGSELVFSTEQMSALLASSYKLYTPDFLWDSREPQSFYKPGSLPALTSEDDLETYGSLVSVEVQAEGSARVINDETILDQFDLYQAT